MWFLAGRMLRNEPARQGRKSGQRGKFSKVLKYIWNYAVEQAVVLREAGGQRFWPWRYLRALRMSSGSPSSIRVSPFSSCRVADGL